MIHQRRLHLSLPRSEASAQREESRQRLCLTPEQAVILNLLDRVMRIEKRLAAADAPVENIFGEVQA